METRETLRTLLAVRSFKSRELAQDSLLSILEAGRQTGSARNLQPWHFVVVQERAHLEKLGALCPTGPYVAEAAAAIVVAVDKTPFAVSDASRAIHSMMLAAWDEGIGSNWVGFTQHLSEVGRELGIPEQLEVLAVIPLGYPAEPVGQGKKKRKPLDEVAHRERWGEPFREG